MRLTVDAGLRKLYRAVRLRSPDATERTASAPEDAVAEADGWTVMAVRHPKLRSFVARTAAASGMEEYEIVWIATEAEAARRIRER